MGVWQAASEIVLPNPYSIPSSWHPCSCTIPSNEHGLDLTLTSYKQNTAKVTSDMLQKDRNFHLISTLSPSLYGEAVWQGTAFSDQLFLRIWDLPTGMWVNLKAYSPLIHLELAGRLANTSVAALRQKNTAKPFLDSWPTETMR